jgi:hypothetical protein
MSFNQRSTRAELFRHASRPESVYQDAKPVAGLWCLVRSLQLDHLEAPLFCASSSARRRRSARSSSQRAVSSRTIATIASILASAERKSATVKAIERERPSLRSAGTRSTSVPYRLWPVRSTRRYPSQCRSRSRSGMMMSSDWPSASSALNPKIRYEERHRSRLQGHLRSGWQTNCEQSCSNPSRLAGTSPRPTSFPSASWVTKTLLLL